MRGDEDAYTVKSEMCGMEDSETSLCEIDDGMRPNSASDHHIQVSSSVNSPFNTTITNNPHGMMVPSHLTDLVMLGGGPTMSHQQSSPLMFSPPPPPPLPPPPSITHHGVLHGLHISNPTTVPNMTPIDKLYSMQNSYFSNPSEIEC